VFRAAIQARMSFSSVYPVGTSPYLFVRQLGEPPLDQVEPGRAGGREVQVEA
jgi:hypothetical protein